MVNERLAEKSQLRVPIRSESSTHLASAASRPHHKVFAEDIDESSVHSWADVVELGNEGMLEPIDKALGNEDDDGKTKDGLQERKRR